MMKMFGIGALVIAANMVGFSPAQSKEPVQHHHPSHHEMMYGHHNHYYHHFYRNDHHHATATGGPSGGLPHRN